MNKLENLGFDEWFRSRVDADKAEQHEVARVISVHRDSCVVTKGESEISAECSGHLLYASDSPLDLPTTGDWVYADFYDDDMLGIVHEVLPRKSVLKRKTAGKSVEFQLIAANIDVAFIMQSADDNFNLRRLERYLAMVNDSNIMPVIVMSKSDLASPDEVEGFKQDIVGIAPQTSVIAYSNVTGENVAKIKQSLRSGKTYCLLGSSGVGKTTLINSIIGSERFETQEVSRKQSKGRHTTTSRELVQLANGALLIDTPGMRELGSMAMDSGIDQTFAEIAELAKHCRFRDCSHSNEKGCAVLAAMEVGELDEHRYKNYVKLKNESAYHDMSYVEKRRKDKDFGKMVKSVIMDKNRYR